MSDLLQVAARPGVLEFLRALESTNDFIPHDKYRVQTEDAGIDASVTDALVDEGLLHKAGAGLYFSNKGRAVTLLLMAIKGEVGFTAIPEALNELFPTARPYELIEGQITEYFIQMLENRPEFSRLCICSPWIRLDEDSKSRVREAVRNSRSTCGDVRIEVVTCPERGYRNRSTFRSTMEFLAELGADFVVHKNLHAKLYICEPGANGRFHYAIFGSENLTGAGWVELGVRVEGDRYMMGRLTQFFEAVYAASELPKKEDA